MVMLSAFRRHNSMSAVRPPVQSTLRPREGSDLHRPTGVNLRRSKTSVGTLSQPYPPASVQAVTRSYSTAPQFRPFVARYRPADIPLHGQPSTINSQYRKMSRGGPSRLELGDQFCEFQAAPSFDLPTIDILKRATTTASSGKSDVSRDRWDDDRKSSSVVFEGEEPLSPHCLFGQDIRYQGMDALGSPVDRNNNSVKQKKSLMKNYYSSWEDLLEKSEIAERSNLARRRHYGSTESINSSGSEGSRPNPAVYAYQKQQEHELMQAAGHHLQLHAVHNQTYQTASSSALETCPELDESDVSVQMYDLPRNAPAASVKKSNSRVCSSGKLCLRVESFSEKRNNTSATTQTETTAVQRRTSTADSGKYVGLYQKSPSR
jgi:hypothetical protein